MADGAVGFLLERINFFLEKELHLPQKINAKVSSLRLELESMKAPLKDANAKGEHDHQVGFWVQEVRNLAYEIEDVLDMFALHMARQSIVRGLEFITKWRAHHFLDDRIEDINSKLEVLTKTRERYHNISSSSSSQASSSTGNYTNLAPKLASWYMKDADVVGFEEPKKKLISWALDRRQRLKVMFIVGMGGSGKTALAKKVFERVKEDFDCHALITLSKSRTKLEHLWTIFNQFCSNPMPEEPTPQESSLCSDLFFSQHHYSHCRHYFRIEVTQGSAFGRCIFGNISQRNCGTTALEVFMFE